MSKPQILKKLSAKDVREAGCCFRSCGGMPCVLQYNKGGKQTTKKLAAIK